MAESIVQVTEGSGKKLHTFNRTIGANSVEDEVVIPGENYLATYVVGSSLNPSTATAASHLLQIMAGASLKVRIRRIEIWQSAVVTAAALLPILILRVTTAGTGGTAATPALLDTTDGASGATAMFLPTVKGTESTSIAAVWPYMIQTIGASMPFAGPVAVLDFDGLRGKPLVIAAGAANGIVLKNVNAVAAGSLAINVYFSESSF